MFRRLDCGKLGMESMMNERIKELIKCNERIQNFFETGPVQRAAIEDFAELIVRECARIMDKDADHPYNSRGNILKYHFGVEE